MRSRLAGLRWLYPAFFVLLVALLAESAGLVASFDQWLGDVHAHFGKRPSSGSIVIVDIDSRSLSSIGTWPWPRHIHAELLDKLTALGAAEVTFDIDFSTASDPTEDTALAAALERAGGSAVLASFAQAPSARLGDPDLAYNVPLAAFLANAWTASVNVRPDPDGRIRRLPYGEVIAGLPTQSLSAMLAGVPAPERGDFAIDFSIRAETIDRISAIDVLNGKVDRNRIAGKKVVIGAGAVELRDLFQVPVYGIMSGSLLQALGAETVLQGRVIETSDDVVRYGGLLLIALLFLIATRRLRWVALLGALVILSAGVEISALLMQALGIVRLPTALWQTAILGFAIASVGSEIDFRRILLLISRTETSNVKTILDRVISDNFAGVLVLNPDGTIRVASRAAARLLGVDRLEGEPFETVVPAKLAAATNAAIEEDDSGAESRPKEIRISNKDGLRILEYVVTVSRLEGGLRADGVALPDRKIATLTFVDVTERRAAEARIAYLARFDSLTGLPNRNHFEERLDEALARHRATGERCAVLFFDLDRFKAVNDTLGHDYGDRLLTAVARRLVTVIRSESDLVARFGGDEYAVLLAGPITAEEAGNLAGRLIAGTGEPFDLDGHRVIVGLSVGIAMPQDDATTVGTLMKNADAALYRAKASGGAGYKIFDESIETAVRARRELEVELWDAFSRDEFEVFYQPQVDLVTREITGVEALLRWHHPRRGFVSPAEFVPVAEAVGLIEPLGRWVLEHACAEVAGWPVPVKVAVNVSPVQFVKGDLAAIVEGVIARTGLPGKRLNLEITESLFLQENKAIGTMIERIRALDVTFSIDDFGTGYSSLSYVRKFPVEKIKIDQSFVSELPKDVECAAIVRAVCTLAEGMGISVNAEGIETEEQAAALRLLGCQEGQGYLFGRPKPAASMIELLQAQSGTFRRTA